MIVVPGCGSLSLAFDGSLIDSGSQFFASSHSEVMGTSNVSSPWRVRTSAFLPILKIARFMPTPYMPMVSVSESRSSSGSRPILKA